MHTGKKSNMLTHCLLDYQLPTGNIIGLYRASIIKMVIPFEEWVSPSLS